MANSFEESLAGFDLNFLQPSTNNVATSGHQVHARQDRQKQSILNIKKKIIASNALLKKFYIQKGKLEETEAMLLASKEECKQICVDNKQIQEKYDELEKESNRMKDMNQLLQKNVIYLDNQLEAMKSHANQLQSLVKEHESVICALKIEKELERSNVKDSEKKLTAIEQERDTYLRDIQWMREAILGKKKVKNIQDILNKYSQEKDSGGYEFEKSEDEGNFDDSPVCSPAMSNDSPNEEEQPYLHKITKKDHLREPKTYKVKKDTVVADHDSEIVSEDTGRGSSLALSDNCLNSPDNDYFAGDLNIIIKDPIVQVDVGTSPMRVEENLTSSPNIFDDEALLNGNSKDSNRAKSPEYFISDIPFSTEIVTLKQKQQLVDACTSPHHYGVVHESTSPIIFDEEVQDNIEEIKNKNTINIREQQTQTNTESDKACHMSLNTLSHGCELEISRKSPKKICLEQNNSKNESLAGNDTEVEAILKNMKLHFDLISPIPKSCKKPLQKVTDEVQNKEHNSCPEALKVREENKALKANVDFLCKEIQVIKELLLSNSNNTIQSTNNEPIIHDECSQDTILLSDLIETNNEKENSADSFADCDTISLTTEVENDLICVSTLDCSKELESQNQTSSILDDKQKVPSENDINTKSQDIDQNTDLQLGTNIEHRPNIEESITNDSNSNSNRKSIVDCLRFFNDDLGKNTFSARSKRRKITQLDRFKKRILPKPKIKPDATPTRKRRKVPLVPIVKKDSKKSALEILKDRDAYNRAVKVIADLRAKMNVGENRIFKRKIVTKEDKANYLKRIRNCKRLIFKSKSYDLSNVRKAGKRHISGRSRVLATKERVIPENNGSIKNNLENTLQVRNKSNNVDLISNSEKNIKTDEESDNLKQTSYKGGRASIPEGSNVTSLNGRRRKRLHSTSSNCSNKRVLRSNHVEKETNKEDSKGPDKEPSIHKNLSVPDISGEKGKAKENISSKIDSCILESTRNVNNDVAPKSSGSTSSPETKRKRRARHSDFNSSNKRLLRSSTLSMPNQSDTKDVPKPDNLPNEIENIVSTRNLQDHRINKPVIDYGDLDVFSKDNQMTSNNETATNLNELRGIEFKASEKNKDCSDSDSSLSPRDSVRRKRLKRLASNESVSSTTRLLRSSTLNSSNSDSERLKTTGLNVNNKQKSQVCCKENIEKNVDIIGGPSNERLNGPAEKHVTSSSLDNLKNSILCKMLSKYGKTVIKTSTGKVPDKKIDAIYNKIEHALSEVMELPLDKTQKALDKLIEDLRKIPKKHFLLGLMKYLQDPARKLELYNKLNGQIQMTKKEHCIVYIIKQLNSTDVNIMNEVLGSIEYSLFHLNKTPDFDTIESLSHLYAVICRIYHLKSRLKLFLLDAMYCLQFKAIAVVKQCITAWTHVLPLAHMAQAKCPLVTCIVYLLHFFKCEQDRMNRVGDIRWILQKKYFFNFTEWNQAKILEVFNNAIKTVKDIPDERSMLRMAIIIFAKRQGPKWCQRVIINNMLLPMINSSDTPERVKIFCIKLIGPLLKPYPMNMKVHCEIIVNELLDKLKGDNLSDPMKEAIFTSLVYMSKHNVPRVTGALLSWQPASVSAEFETLIKSYVQEKPIKAWKHILCKAQLL